MIRSGPPKRFMQRTEDPKESDEIIAHLVKAESKKNNAQERTQRTQINERFLRSTLQSTETHNQRISGLPAKRPSSKEDSAHQLRRVDIVLREGETGIVFESISDRPFIKALTSKARRQQTSLRPGMHLSKIAGVKCKHIPYQAALDLIRTLDRPLRLTFKNELSQDKRRKKRKFSPDERS